MGGRVANRSDKGERVACRTRQMGSVSFSAPSRGPSAGGASGAGGGTWENNERTPKVQGASDRAIACWKLSASDGSFAAADHRRDAANGGSPDHHRIIKRISERPQRNRTNPISAALYHLSQMTQYAGTMRRRCILLGASFLTNPVKATHEVPNKQPAYQKRVNATLFSMEPSVAPHCWASHSGLRFRRGRNEWRRVYDRVRNGDQQ